MFEVIRHQIGQDEQLSCKFKSDVGKLAMLMRHEGTALGNGGLHGQADEWHSAAVVAVTVVQDREPPINPKR